MLNSPIDGEISKSATFTCGTVQNDLVPIKVKDTLDTFSAKGKLSLAHLLIAKGNDGLPLFGCWTKTASESAYSALVMY